MFLANILINAKLDADSKTHSDTNLNITDVLYIRINVIYFAPKKLQQQ